MENGFAVVHFGNRPNIAIRVDADTHGKIGLAAVGSEFKLANKREGVFVDQHQYFFDVTVIALLDFGIDF